MKHEYTSDELKTQTHTQYQVKLGHIIPSKSGGVVSYGGYFSTKQEALDQCKHLMDTESIESRTATDSNGNSEVFDFYVVKVTTIVGVEGEDDSPSTPLSDEAIYNLMTSLKDSWHHFNRETLESSFKNVVGRVWYRIKKHCNPDMDWKAMVNENWLDQSYMGELCPYPDQDDIDSFNEYVENWKYPRIKKGA